MDTPKQKLSDKAVDYGRIGFRLALKAGALYALLTFLGVLFGGIGAVYAGGYYFDYGAWFDVLCAFMGMALGGITGFFAAQMVIFGLIEEALFSAGIKAGKVGFKKALALLKERRGKS